MRTRFEGIFPRLWNRRGLEADRERVSKDRNTPSLLPRWPMDFWEWR